VNSHDGALKICDIIKSEGSELIREKVFDKILETEKGLRAKGSQRAAAITSENYRFDVVAAEKWAGRTCSRLRITPRRKDKFLIAGEIWVDAEEGAVARIQGSPAKTPSLWTTHTMIDRRYRRIDGVWLCEAMLSTSDIFIGGHSTLRVDYDYTSVVTEDIGD
jgi:hypothetical protein